MKENILITVLIVLVLLLTIIVIKNNTKIDIKNEPTISEVETIVSETTQPEATEIVLDVIEIKIIEPQNLEEANAVLDGMSMRLTNAIQLFNILKTLGYSENHPAMVLAKTEISNAENNFEHYEIIQQKFEEERKWEIRLKEYPVATKIWLYLKDLGYNDQICAGIMGNIMSEVGGQTLNIQYKLYSNDKCYYGICQWSTVYKEIWDAELTEQCNFLASTIQYEIDTFGYIYHNGFTFNDFLNIIDEREAALAFAKTYERCNSKSYFIRQENATTAYNYFTS